MRTSSSLSLSSLNIGNTLASVTSVPHAHPTTSWNRPSTPPHPNLAFSTRFAANLSTKRSCRPRHAPFSHPRASQIAAISRMQFCRGRLLGYCYSPPRREPTMSDDGSFCMENLSLWAGKHSSALQCRSDFSPSTDTNASDPNILFSAPQQTSDCFPFSYAHTFGEANLQIVESEMTVTAGITIANGQLLVKGKSILTHVPGNVVLTAATGFDSVQGVFLGASSLKSSSHHVFQLGVLKNLRFVCCFRFSLWWMTQRMGTCGKDVPLETQFFLLESKDGSPLTPEMDSASGDQTVYTVFLPLLEGAFRSSLQGNENDELELCLESGDVDVQTNGGLHSVFLHAGTDPFQVIAEAVKAMQMHMQTFQCRDEKKMPGILDWFGWCTWDAFYTDISANGVREGLRSLEEGGTPARFVIIDDGWQSVESEQQQFNGEATAGTQFAKRLTAIKENYKFQKDGKVCKRQEDPALGLKHLIHEIKEKHNLKYVYVWHAITGYWGGIKPDAAEMEQYESALKYPIHSPGVLDNQPKMSVDSLTVNGLGLAHPKKIFQFYNELHTYLAAAGIDGVKVDVQNILESLGAGFGGRVSLTRHYHQALEASIARNFTDNGCIACMSHNTDGLYSIKQTAVVRASDDFWPRDPASHTIHIASVAYNSMFLGEFMQPDWDMFQSLHPAAEYHAAARAIGGCPIYVSDKPGNHDFDLLKRLVLPDGSILRAQLPGRPTRDCLFTDPARDGKSLLKIWNINKYTGVLGAFNCQGAGWCKVDRRNLIHGVVPVTVTGSVHARDVEFLGKVAPEDWDGDCAIYTHKGGELICLPKSAALPVTLNVLEYELYTASPIKRLTSRAAFAPIGLLHMFNSGGAIFTLEYELHGHGSRSGLPDMFNLENCEAQRTIEGPIATIRMKVYGSGEFGVYSSVKPRKCVVNSVSTDLSYKAESGLVTFSLPATKCKSQDVIIEI